MTDELTEVPLPLNPLPSETVTEAREKRSARRMFARVLGPFVRAMDEAMTAYRKARSEGVEREDAIKGLEEVVRAVWPKPVTKFGPQCLVCDDIGYEELICRQYVRCARERCNEKGEDWQHRYVAPCLCVKGDKFRAKVSQEDQASTLGKVTKKRGGFQRMGS